MSKKNSRPNKLNLQSILRWSDKFASFSSIILAILGLIGTVIGLYFAHLSLENHEEIQSLKEIAINTEKNNTNIQASLDSLSLVISELKNENEKLSNQTSQLSKIATESNLQSRIMQLQFQNFLEKESPKITVDGVNNGYFELQNSENWMITYLLILYGGRPITIENITIRWFYLDQNEKIKHLDFLHAQEDEIWMYPSQTEEINTYLTKEQYVPFFDKVHRSYFRIVIDFEDQLMGIRQSEELVGKLLFTEDHEIIFRELSKKEKIKLASLFGK